MLRSLTFAFLLLAGGLQAQSFQRGTLVTDFNTGLELYESTSTYQRSAGDTMVETLAANSNYALGMEIGLGKRIGIGLRGKANIFFRELDKVTQQRSDVLSKDLLLQVNLHPVVTKHFDLLLGAEIGLSNLHIDVNDLSNSVIEGKGGYYALYLNPRIYFRRLGFNLKTYLPYINYKNLVSENPDPAAYMLDRWKGSGFGISLGVQLRLF